MVIYWISLFYDIVYLLMLYTLFTIIFLYFNLYILM